MAIISIIVVVVGAVVVFVVVVVVVVIFTPSLSRGKDHGREGARKLDLEKKR